MSKQPHAQMQRRPATRPEIERTRALIVTGWPALRAAYQALIELNPATFSPATSERDLSSLYRTALLALAGLELGQSTRTDAAARAKAWAKARERIGQELGLSSG